MKKSNKNNKGAELLVPQAVQFEEKLLGTLLAHQHVLSNIRNMLEVSDFFNGFHQEIYRTILILADENVAFDCFTTTEALKKLGSQHLDEEIERYLLHLAVLGGSPQLIKYYAIQIKEATLKREGIRLNQQAIEKLRLGQQDSEVIFNEQINALNAQIEALSKSQQGLVIQDFTEFLQEDMAPKEMILEPFLTRSSLTMVYGKRGLGKSWLVTEIALAVACGKEFLGWKAVKPFGVLLLDGEMSDNVLQERFLKIVSSRATYPEKPFKLISPDKQARGMPDLGTLEGQRIINKAITPDIDLIIVDNLSTLVRSGKENEAESWLPVQSWALKLRSQGKAIIFVHHASRGGTARGTSRREDILDTVIALKQPEDYSSEQGARFEVHFEKARNFRGDPAKPFLVELTDSSGRLKWELKSLAQNTFERVVELANGNPPMKQRDIAAELGISLGQVNKYLQQAKEINLYSNKGLSFQ